MTLIGANGTIYRLDPTPIGSGGEGDIYLVRSEESRVAKIYKAGALTPELLEKLKVMIANPPDDTVLSQVAWPLDIVHDEYGKCRGFIMPKLHINAELNEIYKYPAVLPLSAKQKINIAQNICVVISEVHRAGYVFGDFNPRNIGLDKNTGLVSFLDTDTYHVVDPAGGNTYRCNVCASGYAAPELLEKCSDYISANPTASRDAYAQTPLPTFTRETDNFALAIHIFKLLMNGYTPFGGIIETASVSQSSPGVGDAAVRRNSYCFRPGYKPQSVAIPGLETLPEEIADLFTRAFIEGRVDARKRPNAVEWHGALGRYEQQLATCYNNPLHQYDRKNSQCPLCEADRRYAEAVGSSPAPSLKQTTYAPPPLEPAQAQPTHTQATQPSAPTQARTSYWNKIVAAACLVFMVISAAIAVMSAGNTQGSAETYAHASNNQGSIVAADLTGQTIGNVGNIVEFGGHTWRVLDVQTGRALLLSEYILEHRQYHHTNQNVTWSSSSIRHYLNNTFYNTFSEADRSLILETEISNLDNQWFGTPGGNNTFDKIFLLSLEQVVWHFGNSGQLGNRSANRLTINDSYNSERIAIARYLRGMIGWWLRSPGRYDNRAVRVNSSGAVSVSGASVDLAFSGVRPALWLSLEPAVVATVPNPAQPLAATQTPTLAPEPVPEPTPTPSPEQTLEPTPAPIPEPILTPTPAPVSAVAYITIRGEQFSTSLTRLELTERNLQNADIAHLRYMTNLTRLNLARNQISDLSPLSNLTNLTDLLLSNNQISNLIPLSSLTNLTVLDLFGNQVSDLTPLSGITNFTSLDLRRNPINDWSPVAHVAHIIGRPEAVGYTPTPAATPIPTPISTPMPDMISLQEFSDVLGLRQDINVIRDPANRTITLILPTGRTVQFEVDSSIMLDNGAPRNIVSVSGYPVSPIEADGDILLPLVFMAEVVAGMSLREFEEARAASGRP
ncbi:MAG: DUF6273 domain-containing protein [Defluviitaleaceae bacterium]|nr:DUF6273 domain-containing protein [Defluviitaleaceae bacterium]